MFQEWGVCVVNFVIKEKIYNIPLFILIGTWDEYNEQLHKKYKIERKEQKNYGGEATFYTGDGSSLCSIWLPQFDISCIADITDLVHEIDHISQYIMEHFDIPILTGRSNHAYIYLKEYFTVQTLTKLKRLSNG